MNRWGEAVNTRFPDKPRGECTRRHGVRADDRGKPAGPATAAFLLPDVGEEGGYETGRRRRRTRRADLASRALSTDIEAPQAHPRPSLGLTPGLMHQAQAGLLLSLRALRSDQAIASETGKWNIWR